MSYQKQNLKNLINQTLKVFVSERDLAKHNEDVWVALSEEAYSFLEELELLESE